MQGGPHKSDQFSGDRGNRDRFQFAVGAEATIPATESVFGFRSDSEQGHRLVFSAAAGHESEAPAGPGMAGGLNEPAARGPGPGFGYVAPAPGVTGGPLTRDQADKCHQRARMRKPVDIV